MLLTQNDNFILSEMLSCNTTLYYMKLLAQMSLFAIDRSVRALFN